MIHGSCHCGEVKFSLDEKQENTMQCNCSICRRKAYLLIFSTPDKFSLHTPRDQISEYTFGHGAIRHQFCKRCGCAPFGEGIGPDGEQMVAINLRCAENIDLENIVITNFDGASL